MTQGVNLANMITRLMTTALGLAETARDVLERSDVSDPSLEKSLDGIVDQIQGVMVRVQSEPKKFGQLGEEAEAEDP